MVSRASKLECFILFLAALMLSVGPSALYVKLFNYAPPLPNIVVQLPIMGLMILNIVYRLREAVFGVFSALPFMLLILLALASYTWSYSPQETLNDAVIFLVSGVYVVMAAYLFDWRDIIRMSWLAFVCVSLISLFLYFAVPKLGQMQEVHVGALSGMWMEKNYAGQVGVFGAALTVARIAMVPTKTLSSLLGLMVFMAVTLLSTSATALVALLFSLALAVWVFAMRRNTPVFVISLWLTIFCVVPMAAMVIFDTETVLKLLGRNSTFTGRAQIWEAVRQYSLEGAGTLGYGFNAYWSEDYDFGNRSLIFEQLGYTANHSHNSVLELWLSLGKFGASLLVVGASAALLLSLAKIRHSAGAYFAIPFLGSAIVIGSFESTFAAGTNFGSIMLILILAKMVRQRTALDAQSGLAIFWYKMSNYVRNAQARPAYS